MKHLSGLIAGLFFISLVTVTAYGQQPTISAENADRLRLELVEVQAKEEMLRLRLEELDDELKPENIERALAGIGSTKPEELREARRRLLTIEKTAAVSQLEIVQKTRSRLEEKIAAADVQAYHESAAPTPKPIDPVLAMRAETPLIPVVFTVVSSVFVIILVGLVFLTLITRRRL